MTVIYRTSGPWGAGKGSNLVPAEVDGNFYDHETRVTALETNPPEAIGIAYFETNGSQFYVHMTDSTVLGPYALPAVSLNFRGAWQPFTSYANHDVISANGATYMVLLPHSSASVFDPGANDGAGHDYYGLLLENPANVMPPGGTTGQALIKVTDTDFETGWADMTGVPPGGDASQVLAKNTASDGDTYWADPASLLGGALALDDLSDVGISSLAEGDELRYGAPHGTLLWFNQPPENRQLLIINGASWQPIKGNEGAFVIFNSSSSVTVTIPAQGTADLALGCDIHLHQNGTGPVTITAETGVSILVHADFSATLLGQYATASLKKTDFNVWRLFGLLAPV